MSSWTKQRIRHWLRDTEFNEYQGIDLPHGLRVPGPDRSPTIGVAFHGLDIRDKQIYVIGSHYGAVPCLLAERGAQFVLGIEARPKYQEIAQAVIEIKGLTGKVRYIGGSCEGSYPPGAFDYITMFNVNHHFHYPAHTIAMNARQATIAFLLEWATFETYNERHADHQVDAEYMEQWPIFLGDKYGKWYASEKAIEQTLRKVGFTRFIYLPSPKARTRRIVQCLRK
jgi:hypothetical protein